MSKIYSLYLSYNLDMSKSLMEETSLFNMISASICLTASCAIPLLPISIFIVYFGYGLYECFGIIVLLSTIVARQVVKNADYKYIRLQYVSFYSNISAKIVFIMFYCFAIGSFWIFSYDEEGCWHKYVAVLIFSALACMTAVNSRLLKDRGYSNV